MRSSFFEPQMGFVLGGILGDLVVPVFSDSFHGGHDRDVIRQDEDTSSIAEREVVEGAFRMITHLFDEQVMAFLRMWLLFSKKLRPSQALGDVRRERPTHWESTRNQEKASYPVRRFLVQRGVRRAVWHLDSELCLVPVRERDFVEPVTKIEVGGIPRIVH